MLGAGLGAGIMSGGRLFTGGGGGAGVLGRMRLVLPGKGVDGKPSSVTELVNSEGITRLAVERLERSGVDTLAGVPPDQIDADLVIDQALAGDAMMVGVLADVGWMLGVVVSATLCVTDSNLVLLCGPTTRAGDLIVDPLRQTLEKRAPFPPPEVRTGHLGRLAGPLGAAALVLTDFVQEVGVPVDREEVQ